MDKKAYLSLGSNLGDRAARLEAALVALNEAGVRVVAKSPVYETEPQEVTKQPWFLNLVVEVATSCFPVQLLAIVQRIEREMGRTRMGEGRRGPRVIDIDILLFARVVMNTPRLTIPHARMSERRFVLQPLLDLSPDERDPRTGERWRGSLERLQGQAVRHVTDGKDRDE